MSCKVSVKTRALSALLACGSMASSCEAATLYEAFGAASAGNEVIGSQQAAVRVSEQDKVLAKTGYLPSVASTYDYGYDDLKGKTPTTSTQEAKTHPRGYGMSLSQNLFNGFKTTKTVAREDASLTSERDKLCDVEQRILVDVATAYVDVIRDNSIVELRRRDRELLKLRDTQTKFRFQIGDLTRTDVDQIEASLAKTEADLIIAETNRDASVADYQAVVGRLPDKLEPASVPERLLPHDIGTALAIADAEHPAIQAALASLQAAELNIDVERASFAPSFDVVASTARRWDPQYYTPKTELTDMSVMGRLTIPIYDRGVTYASVHRASELATQSHLQLDHQRIGIHASVIQNHNAYFASKAVIASADAQIAASVRALEGVDLEATAGQRTTLDVLIAQRSLLDARVNREIAQRDRIVAGYRYLASLGRLSIGNLSAEDTRDRSRITVGFRTPGGPSLDRFPSGWAASAKDDLRLNDTTMMMRGSIEHGVADGRDPSIAQATAPTSNAKTILSQSTLGLRPAL